ncbi:potassium transporter Kef [Nitrospira sp. KM1]|uniref:cation:proton antiporter n=1 Tax=Nitrospira sp. KM1 TaxID=1936990 RepID=UPI0013A77757|nr:cation:proton antiporter [Nitrospira sp. KM1]BCA56079.1 potassium transporter Kef [Nitrospira sp. KM1]
MEPVFFTVSLWLALAVASALIASRLRLSIALIEICVGTVAAAALGLFGLADLLAANSEWVRFLAASGAVVLTFLAGAELDPDVLRLKLREVSVVGLVGFAAPLLGTAAAAHYMFGWDADASWLCGIALSTTSTAVIYAVMLDTGFNKTEFGKGVLGACFVNDLSSVIALGLLFAPLTYKTFVFIAITVIVLGTLPYTTAWLTTHFAFRTAAIRTKWVMLVLFGLGGLALWSGSEAVVPAYLVGMVLAGSAARDAHWMRRLRTLTVGFLTPFYFLRAGTLVSLPALVAAPLVFLALLGTKMASKILGLYPVIGLFRKNSRERWYYTLLMSTGLTFGTIASLYGLAHGLVTPEQYSYIVAAVIASAVAPTLIAGMFFVPAHLLPEADRAAGSQRRINGLSDEG